MPSELLKYLKSTESIGLLLNAGESNQITAHIDASWASEKGNNRRSRTGIAIFYGDALVFYKSIVQKCVALSSTEAEYIALSDGITSVLWLKQVLNEMGITQLATRIMQDNSGSVAWCTKSEGKDFARKRHIDLKYHHIRHHINTKEVIIEKVPEAKIKADFLTKVLSPQNLKLAKYSIQMV